MKFSDKIFSVSNIRKDIFIIKTINIFGIKAKFKKIDHQKLIDRLTKAEKQQNEMRHELTKNKKCVEEQQIKIIGLSAEYVPIEKLITGNNNKICTIDKNGNEVEITQKEKDRPFYIKGNNNKVVFYRSKGILNRLPQGLVIKIKGNNNNVVIYEPDFTDSMIYIEKDNNFFQLKPTIKNVWGAYFNIERGASIIIEEDCELGNGKFRCFANGDYINKHKIVIKKGTRIAHDTIIRNSDGQCLIDPLTHTALSEPQDIIIGENCWITTRCTIIKGANLPPNTIVAACSLVNKSFEKEHTLIGGVPARTLRENVEWMPYNYGEYMEYMEDNKQVKL